ncbi:MAG: TIGR00282 family metallophosphoesterase [Oscillospiraceae bacterium]|nr:TIGR00282 family metallophosphoesterase [Oscillospiraceae bacterium]
MKILFLGDIVGSHGCRFVRSKIFDIKKQYNIDTVIVNGENSADGNGITPASADMLSFADVITTGNHCFRRKEMMKRYDEPCNVIRPANYPEGAPGKGVYIHDMGSARLAVINLMGTVYLEALDNPFTVIDRILEDIDTPNILVDFHAEATSEKKAMGQYLAGRVTAVIGTHTHVQTADETILSGHTAYITDAGMCGAELSVLGVKSELAINKMKTHLPVKFAESDNPPFLNGVIIEYDKKNGKALSVERIILR